MFSVRRKLFHTNLIRKFSINLWFDLKLLKDSGEEKEKLSFCQSLTEALPLA